MEAKHDVPSEPILACPGGGFGGAAPFAGVDGERMLSLLTEVGALADSLPAIDSLERIARALLPALGDACAVDLEGEGGGLERVLVVHADPKREPQLRREMRRVFDAASGDQAPTRCCALHESELHPQLSPTKAQEVAVDALATSALVVPLVAHRQAVGAITLVSHEPQRPHTPGDVAAATLIAERVALSILVRRAESVAEQAHAAAERAFDRTCRLEAVTAALSNALTCTEAADVITRQVVEGVGASSAAVAQLDEGDALRVIAARGVPTQLLGNIPFDSAMPAMDALRSMEPIFIESVADREARYPHMAPMHAATGNGAFAAIPLAGTRCVFGVVGLTFAAPRRFSADERAFLLTLAHHCAQALERARLYDIEHAARVSAEAARRRAEFFAATGQVLSGSLDERGMAAAIAQLAATHIADWCIVDLIDRAGRREHAAVAHADMGHCEQIGRLAAMRPSPDAGDPLSIVTRTGMEMIAPSANVAAWTGLSTEERSIWGALGEAWIGCFPIAARDQTFGAILVGGKSLAAETPPLGRELANQLAIALDRARLYEAARQAVRAREEMVAIVSHDLRSPLFAISASAQLLLRSDTLTRAQVVSSAQSTRRAVTRMNRLISDVLDGERIASGQLVLDLQAHDVRALIDDAIEPQRAKARESDVRLETAVAGEACSVTCDRERIAQVITNLVDNAIKFTPRGGSVHVGASRDGACVAVQVTDTGEGIDPEALPHIFERYWRGPQSGRSAVGLGLAIVKGIIDAHKGTIRVESRRGAGTTVRFTLPAAEVS